ncbi:hypothetical protein T484DRAFT_3375803 [Baffinella frigidus]|nr:hypothetical protein T484DRAFT_3375803 [Cryptophyta sp. CCMP2293]
MHYGYSRLGARTFVAKIEEDNEASISLFKKLGFEQTSHSSAFKQCTLEWVPSAGDIAALHAAYF